MKHIMIFLMLISLVGCSSTTIIRTNSKTAKIYIDDQFIGSGEAIHTDKKLAWTSSSIKITDDGCHDFHTRMTKNEQLDVSALIGGILLIVPLFWVMKYKAQRTFHLDCQI